MTSSLEDLPGEVLEQIFLFVRTPRALCRVGTTCSSLSEAVTTNERVWNHIYKKRWMHRDSSVESFSYRDYKARHVQDHKTLKLLLEVSKIVEHKQDYGLGQVFRDPLWEELLKRQNSFDIICSVARNDPQLRTLYERTPFSLMTRCLAAQLADWVQFVKVMHQMNVLMKDVRSRNPSDSAVEEVALLMAESQRTWQELIVSKASTSERIDTTRQKLDELGRQLQSRIDECGGHVDPIDVVGLLYTMLVDEMGISVTNVYNNVEHTSIERVLKPSGRGLSITVAVIFQCILRRVGVSVTIVYDIDRVILGLPGNGDAFVDVFGGCLSLSSRDLLRALQSNDDAQGRLVSVPLEKVDLAILVVDSAFRCLDATIHGTRTTTVHTARDRASFLTWLACSPSRDIANVGLRCFRYLDPGVFRHYNLINDDTMRRHDEAPFFDM